MAHMLASYISLPGTTAAAMQHWQSVFGGELELVPFAAAQQAAMPVEPPSDAVAYASLTLPAGVLSGGDALDALDARQARHPERGGVGGGADYLLSYTADTPEEAERYIAGLIAGGGMIALAFEQAPFGDWYGQVCDRFGVVWAFACAGR